jgi:undecaprenyl pyrophosphate phosphatase UppP
MNLSQLSKGIISVSAMVIITIILYFLYEREIIPFVIFIIAFGLALLLSIFIWIKPTPAEWKEFTVIPIKRKKY